MLDDSPVVARAVDQVGTGADGDVPGPAVARPLDRDDRARFGPLELLAMEREPLLELIVRRPPVVDALEVRRQEADLRGRRQEEPDAVDARGGVAALVAEARPGKLARGRDQLRGRYPGARIKTGTPGIQKPSPLKRNWLAKPWQVLKRRSQPGRKRTVSPT